MRLPLLGKATELKIWIDESGLTPKAECSDIVFTYGVAVDSNETFIPDYSELVDIEIAEDATLINVERMPSV